MTPLELHAGEAKALPSHDGQEVHDVDQGSVP
jgi:hypothetical protein